MIIAGGGTGGHLFPAIAVAEEMKRRSSENDILFVGTARGIEGKVLPEEGWPLRFVAAEGVKGRGLVAKMRALLKTFYGTLQSLTIIRSFRPAIILGVGGYASAPVMLAGRIAGIRTAIHEQNAMPGLTNRLLGKMAGKIFLSYAESERFFPGSRVVVTGNPVRKAVLDAFKEEGKVHEKERFTLLVFGGSRGAKRINEALSKAVKDKKLAHLKGLRIIHQTGHEDLEMVKKAYNEGEMEARIEPFIKDMGRAYKEADLVLCRAGATTITELLAAGKASILVPYPHAADDHQRVNAQAIVNKGAAIMVPDSDLTAERVAHEVNALFNMREKLGHMGKKAKGLAGGDAAQKICDELSRLVAA
ncbi:MAG: undecaprenyldiphospho-muramoylpentapeptide beta-N-acetylglucosaminyltransferase [Deltaproteobacteria bacterium]|nr:undecaprenyldiphospho-muramoylpentapeptide beta-N-acetylglucosaminyltransferase [Deltaproteobacteria bacterium]